MQRKNFEKDEKIFVPQIGAQETQIYRKDGINRFVEVKNSMFNMETVCINFIVYDPKKEKGNKKTEEINAFINFENALLFCDKVLSGEFENVLIKYYIDKLRPLAGQLAVMKKKAIEAGKTDEASKLEKLFNKTVATVNNRDIDDLEEMIKELSAVNGMNANTGVKMPVLFRQMGGTSAEKLKRQDKARSDGNGESRQIKLTVGEKKRYVLSAESGPGKQDEKGLIVPLYGTKPEHRIIIGMSHDEIKGLALVLKAHINSFLSAKYTKIILGTTEDNLAKLFENGAQTSEVVVKADPVEHVETKHETKVDPSEPSDAEIAKTLETIADDDLPF